MRLVCPSCEATYDVPDDRLGSGPRRLRCARCAHVWTREPVAEPPPAPPPLVAEPRRAAVSGFPDYEEERQPPLDHLALTAWAASVAVVLGLVVAGVAFREDVMGAWPPSQRLYAMFGAAMP